MSYEGYEQCICSNGHYFERDCFDHNGVCPVCLAKSTWWNGVDQTNGPDQGAVPMEVLKEKFLLSEEQINTCDHCHASKVIANAIFRIPTFEETVPLCVYTEETITFPRIPSDCSLVPG